MKNIYEKIYVIGQGAPPLACMKLLKNLGITSSFFEISGPLADFTHKAAQGNSFPLEQISENDFPALFNEKQRILVFSVNNMLIFPQWLVQLENIHIINYHNSLLPAHRGVHAEAWAIYEGDEQTGISWHLVDAGIDTGPLVAQKSLPVGNLTSLELLKRQCDLAVETLSESLGKILSGNMPLAIQSPCTAAAHKRREKPNNGILDLSWPTKKIWNFLRAFDYGALETLGKPQCSIDGRWHTWQDYLPLEEHSVGQNDYVIPAAGVILKNICPLPSKD